MGRFIHIVNPFKKMKWWEWPILLFAWSVFGTVLYGGVAAYVQFDRARNPPTTEVANVSEFTKITGLILPKSTVILKSAYQDSTLHRALAAELQIPRSALGDFLSQPSLKVEPGVLTAPIDVKNYWFIDQQRWTLPKFRKYQLAGFNPKPLPGYLMGPGNAIINLDDKEHALIYIQYTAD